MGMLEKLELKILKFGQMSSIFAKINNFEIFLKNVIASLFQFNFQLIFRFFLLWLVGHIFKHQINFYKSCLVVYAIMLFENVS